MIENNWITLVKPNKVDYKISENKKFGTVVIEPLEKGFGTTLGNALRRVLLSSLQGTAITSIKINGVLHEFSTIEGVREDVTDIIMNLKNVTFNSKSNHTQKLTLNVKGPKEVFSSDFDEHPVAYLIVRMLEIHDRNRFEISGFSLKPMNNNSISQRICRSFDSFEDVSNLSDEDVVSLARNRGIDIAIDLNGHTQNARTRIFAYRAAPIQINYLGYPGTTGATFMDYIVADQILIPPQSQKYYSESPIYLPNTFMPTDDGRKLSQRGRSKEELGLTRDGFVFCCFNSNYKISEVEFDIWMRLLRNVESSVLWLRESNKLSKSNLLLEAEKKDIDPSRLVFAGNVAVEEHLARYQLADLFLDTFIYNAHSTATEALWAGLPIVTWREKVLHRESPQACCTAESRWSSWSRMGLSAPRP